MLTKLKTGLDKGLEFITAVSMAALVVDVTWQVITRFILNDPSSWTEEIATYLMIWVGLLGSAVALNRRAHLGIDYFVGKLDFKKRLITESIVVICVAVFSISVLMLGGYQLVKETFELGQTAPATGIKLGYVYIAVPVAGFFLTIYSLEFLYELIVKFKQPVSETTSNSESEA
jgi:TRAP-type C4-dicarboxylate transport system permease small subunit